MEQLAYLLTAMAIPIVGCFFFLRMILRLFLPGSTRLAIEHAIWQRIVCGKSSHALSLTMLAKCVFWVLGLLSLTALSLSF